MNKKSKLTKDTWANGQPSIEIIPFDHSAIGFERILQSLATVYQFEKPNISSGSDKIMTTLILNNERVEVDMDHCTCSLAFQSEALRDEVMIHLKKTVF